MQHGESFSCGMQDLVPQPGIGPGPPALGAWSLNRWTTREVPADNTFIVLYKMLVQIISQLFLTAVLTIPFVRWENRGLERSKHQSWNQGFRPSNHFAEPLLTC